MVSGSRFDLINHMASSDFNIKFCTSSEAAALVLLQNDCMGGVNISRTMAIVGTSAGDYPTSPSSEPTDVEQARATRYFNDYVC